MTLMDLLQLIKRFIKLVVVIPVICAFVAFVVMLVMPKEYQAVATVTASSEVGALGGIATITASEASNNGIIVRATTNANAKQVALTAKGNNAQSVQEAANAAAQSAANRAQELFAAQSFKVASASLVTNASQSPLKVSLSVLFFVLFIVICGIVVWNTINRPIKSKDDVELVAQIPIIGELPADDQGERLFANVRFVAKDKLNTVCVIPANDPFASRQVAEEIYRAANTLGVYTEVFVANPHAEYLYTDAELAELNIVNCAPLSQGMGAAYLSRNADVVILVVRQWLDSTKEVKAILEEFMIAGITLNGVVLLLEDELETSANKKKISFLLPARFGGSKHRMRNDHC